jgi:hypothetical protein
VHNWAVFIICIFTFFVSRLSAGGGDWSAPALWITALIQVGIALSLLLWNNTFSIIHRRTLLPALFYLLFAGCSPIFNFDWKSSLAVLLVIVNYLFLFQSYHKPDSQLNALNISLVLVLGSFLRPQMLLFFPLFWCGFFRFRSFNLRVFLASLTGIFALVLCIWIIYLNDRLAFPFVLPQPEEIFHISKPVLTVYEWINLATVLSIYIFAGYKLYTFDVSEKIRTIIYLKYLYFSTFFMLFMALSQPEYRSFWELTAYLPISIVFAHYFTLTGKLPVKILMLLFMIAQLLWGFFGGVSLE